jgi:exodeoxyribonuclease VII small subunit
MTKAKSFQQKMAELDELIAWFDSDQIELERAIEKYEQALSLSQELELELSEAKNKIEIINKKFSK